MSRQRGVIGQGGHENIDGGDMEWNGRHMLGGERRRCDSGRGTGVWECDWRKGVGESVGGMRRR
jgi:hypothetical protein